VCCCNLFRANISALCFWVELLKVQFHILKADLHNILIVLNQQFMRT